MFLSKSPTNPFIFGHVSHSSDLPAPVGFSARMSIFSSCKHLSFHLSYFYYLLISFICCGHLFLLCALTFPMHFDYRHVEYRWRLLHDHTPYSKGEANNVFWYFPQSCSTAIFRESNPIWTEGTREHLATLYPHPPFLLLFHATYCSHFLYQYFWISNRDSGPFWHINHPICVMNTIVALPEIRKEVYRNASFCPFQNCKYMPLWNFMI